MSEGTTTTELSSTEVNEVLNALETTIHNRAASCDLSQEGAKTLIEGWTKYFKDHEFVSVMDDVQRDQIATFHDLMGTLVESRLWKKLDAHTQVVLRACQERDHALCDYQEDFTVGQLITWLGADDVARADMLREAGIEDSKYVKTGRLVLGLCSDAYGASRADLSP